MWLPLTLIFFVIFGTENTSPALLVLEIVTFLRLGWHDGGWSNSSLFLAAGSVAVLSKEELQKEAKISISNISMVNYSYLTERSADCLLDLAITGLG